MGKMNLKRLNIYSSPLWLNTLLEELEETCSKELTKESELYNEMQKECGELMEKYSFIAKLVDNDEIEKPLKLSLEETRALSRFLFLESGRRDLEGIEMCLLGCRYTMEVLQLLKMI